MKIVDLFARIGLKTDGDKLKTFLGHIDGARLGLIAAAGAAVTAAIAIQKFTSNALDAAAGMKQLQSETGASLEELQKWRSVATQINVSAQSIDNAIRSISANQEKIKFGEGNISGFQLLGIDPRQDPFQILDELRKKTQGFSQGMRKNIAAQMGLGPDIIQILELTNDEFDKMAGRAFIIPQSAIDGMDKARAAIGQVKDAIAFLYTSIVSELAPEITETAKSFTDFIILYKDDFIKILKEGFTLLKSFVGAIKNTAFMIDTAVSKTVGWKAAIGALIGVFALLNSTILLSPIGLIVAGIILLIAVLDDLYVYSQGGKSLFGVFLENFPQVEDKINSTIRVFKELLDLYRAFASGNEKWANDILDSWGAWGDVIQWISDQIRGINELIDDMSDRFNDFKENSWFGRIFGGGQSGTTAAPVGSGGSQPWVNRGDTTMEFFVYPPSGDPHTYATETGRAVEQASSQLRRDR